MSVFISGKRLKSLPEQVNDNTKLIKEHDAEIKVIEGAIFPDMPDVPDLIDIPDRVDDLEGDVADLKDEDILIKGRLVTLEGIHLYRHSIFLKGTNFVACIEIFNDSSSLITTADEIKEYIGASAQLLCTGYHSNDLPAVNATYTGIEFADEIDGLTVAWSDVSLVSDSVKQLF